MTIKGETWRRHMHRLATEIERIAEAVGDEAGTERLHRQIIADARAEARAERGVN